MKDLRVMFPFYRKRLLIDTDPVELARVSQILKESEIPYQIQTRTSRGAIGRAIDVNIFAQYRRPGYEKILTHVYLIHVAKSDYERARDLITQ